LSACKDPEEFYKLSSKSESESESYMVLFLPEVHL
jgi:hypothetical protein